MLANDRIVSSETLHTGDYSAYDGQYFGRFIGIIGKSGGGKYCLLNATITTMLKRHGWSMSKIMVSDNTVKAASLINSCTIFI